jgi:hypothetical protein
VNIAAVPDATYPTTATTEATQTHRPGPERIAERPRTRAEYIDHVLAQIKATAK